MNAQLTLRRRATWRDWPRSWWVPLAAAARLIRTAFVYAGLRGGSSIERLRDRAVFLPR